VGQCLMAFPVHAQFCHDPRSSVGICSARILEKLSSQMV
jgi:hypothetical protein